MGIPAEEAHTDRQLPTAGRNAGAAGAVAQSDFRAVHVAQSGETSGSVLPRGAVAFEPLSAERRIPGGLHSAGAVVWPGRRGLAAIGSAYSLSRKYSALGGRQEI